MIVNRLEENVENLREDIALYQSQLINQSNLNK